MSEEAQRPRVVFDCMVYLQATLSSSGPAVALSLPESQKEKRHD